MTSISAHHFKTQSIDFKNFFKHSEKAPYAPRKKARHIFFCFFAESVQKKHVQQTGKDTHWQSSYHFDVTWSWIVLKTILMHTLI
ncbi:MAG TPA: hypothetical protein DCE42_20385 [Myxococcales bacterium]|nr:hypothetical protein [Deltaproteobacteria bacterium]MBU48205.1 hypothetical protein [Deltaproteobacteria bacterium]HAA57135.1 hypothetical protein [Myxococcales bacterium]|tara:strand:+ start:9183 stop:9437 length:255 start_codon:yes stop_codon:yes gene_type:complete